MRSVLGVVMGVVVGGLGAGVSAALSFVGSNVFAVVLNDLR